MGCELCTILASVFLVLLVAVYGFLHVFYKGCKTPDDASEEKDTFGNKFSSLNDSAEVDLSLIVPMYNEEERLPVMMKETLDYLNERVAKNSAFTYEIILVDDGSKDTSVAVAEGFAKANPPKGKSSIRVLKLHKNHGKGGAVKKGMMRSSGKALLMVDADGATDINDLGLLEAVLDDQTHVAIGSRAHLENDSMAKRTFLRTVLMKGFHVFVAVVSGVRGIQDTQCGFKLFSRTAARRLFPSQHIERWAFDVELLCLCAAQSINIKEIGVRWQEIDGSKLDVMTDTINMARDLVLIRLCYLLGVWNIEPAKKSE